MKDPCLTVRDEMIFTTVSTGRMLCCIAEVVSKPCCFFNQLIRDLIIAVKECNETDVRLVGGQSAAEGAVQICQNGLWVSVCDTRWDYRGAEIVCRQLGYHGSMYKDS